MPRTQSGVGTLVATDLLAATPTAAPEPDWPIDRRILAGSIAVAVLIAALGIRALARRWNRLRLDEAPCPSLRTSASSSPRG